MSDQLTGQLVGLAIMTVFVGFGIRRRIRPQPVRVNRLLIFGGLITVIVVASFLASGSRVVTDPLALGLAPVFVAAGAVLGAVLVRTMSFWRDEATGQLWMRGGAVFAAILIATIALRLGARAVATGSVFGAPTSQELQQPPTLLNIISADLLFLTLGLWGARAILIARRAQVPIGSDSRQASAPPSAPV